MLNRIKYIKWNFRIYKKVKTQNADPYSFNLMWSSMLSQYNFETNALQAFTYFNIMVVWYSNEISYTIIFATVQKRKSYGKNPQ